MEKLLGDMMLPEVWRQISAHLPMQWRAICCRVCRVWQKELEQPQQGHGDEILVDYGLGTLCSVLATKGVDEVMRRTHLHYPLGIPADGRMDQVRRFVQRHRYTEIESVDEWMQLASQEPDAGWLCKGMSKTRLEGMGKGVMRQSVGKPQEFSELLGTLVHSTMLCFVCYSSDGSTISSACFDRTVRLFDAKTMVEKGALEGHRENNPDCSCWKHRMRKDQEDDGSGSESEDASEIGDKRVYEFDPECPVKGHLREVTCVAYSPDGTRIASAGKDWTVNILDAVTMEEVCSLMGHSSAVNCVACSPDCTRIASASVDKTVKIWDAVTMEEVGTLRGHRGWVLCVAYSPDGKQIASASDDTTVKIWDAVFMEELATLRGHTSEVVSVAFSPDGSQLASAGGDGDKTVNLWDLNTIEHTCTLPRHAWSAKRVAYSPDGKHIISASTNHIYTVKVWDAETKREMYSLTAATLGAHVASWQHLDPEIRALSVLAAKVKVGGSSSETGQYMVISHGSWVCVHGTNADGWAQGELACFLSPSRVESVSCKGTSVVVGCDDGQVLLLEAPLLAGGLGRGAVL